MSIHLLASHVRNTCVILLILFLSGCGGGGSDSTEPPVTINGAGVKGPLANADVEVFAFDSDEDHFQGKSLDKGSTDTAAALTGISLRRNETKQPVILVISTNSNTINLTTGQRPQAPSDITTLRTVITSDALTLVQARSQSIYATPLTTLATDLAIVRVGEGASAEAFSSALQFAAADVVKSFGFGMSLETDIFIAAPLINDQTDSLAEQTSVARYRTAIEAFAAVLLQVHDAAVLADPSNAPSSDDLLSALALDLNDGVIDGANDDTPIEALQLVPELGSLLAVDPATLVVPGTAVMVANVEEILVAETSVTGTNTNVDYLRNSIDVIPSAAILDIINDANHLAPRVVSAISTGNTSLLLTFSKSMDPLSAEVPSHYSIVQSNVNGEVGALLVQSAMMVGDSGQVVELQTSPQNEVTYTILVTNVTDTFGNQLDITRALDDFVLANSAEFAGSPPTVRYACSSDAFGDLAETSCSTNSQCWDPAYDAATDLEPSAQCLVASNDFVDTDGDGISDDKEVRGYDIIIHYSNGVIEEREVTSDPYSPDTDGDGFNDYEEIQYGANPRDSDTDADGISDRVERHILLSDPANQDTDGDGLSDGLEYQQFHTSVVLADTDGDKFSDYEELIELNRHPRIADLPAVNISVGQVRLQIDERFSYTDEQGTLITEESSSNSSLSQSDNTSFSRADSGVTTNTFTFGSETRAGLSDQESSSNSVSIAGLFDVPTDVGMPFAQTQVNLGHEESKTSTWQTDRNSARESQQIYEASLNKSKEISTTRAVTREVFGASIDLDVSVENIGNLSFTLSNIEITVLQRSTTDSAVFLPVATLISNSELSTGTSLELNMGPFTKNKGPFLFSSREVFPNLVEDLMRSPNGLVFEIANYDVTDEFGRNFVFSNQTARDRTFGLLIDEGELGAAQQYIASAGALASSGGYQGGWQADGSPKGLSMDYVLGDILGMAKNSNAISGITAGLDGVASSSAGGDDIQLIPQGTTGLSIGAVVIGAGDNGVIDDETTVDPADDQGYVTGYETSPTCNADSGTKAHFACGNYDTSWCASDAGDSLGVAPACNGPEKLVRVNGLRDGDFNRAWVVMFSGDVPAPVDFGEIRVRAGEDISLAFLQDLDEDGLFARQEYLFGSLDSRADIFDNASFGVEFDLDEALGQGPVVDGIYDSKDTDGDGLGDFAEVNVGWLVSTEAGLYRAYSSPRQRDTDGDGLLDPQELDLSSFCEENDPRQDGLCAFQTRDPEYAYTNDPSQAVAIAVGPDGIAQTLNPSDDYDNPNNDDVARINADAYYWWQFESPYHWAITPGANGVFESIPLGDDRFITAIQPGAVTDPSRADTDIDGINDGAEVLGLEVGHAVVDGGNGIAETTKNGDDVQKSLEGNGVLPGSIIILPGQNGVIDSDAEPLGDDFLTEVEGEQVIACGDNGVLDSIASGDDALVFDSDICTGGNPLYLFDGIGIRPGLNGQLDSTLNGAVADDYVRQARVVVTDPLRRDTESDTIPDGIELAQGSDPTVVDGTNFRDSDFDGLTDAEETTLGWMVSINGGAPYEVHSSPSLGDTDEDGLPDYVERDLGTDPNRADSDQDGLSDLDEISTGDLEYYTTITESFSGAYVQGGQSSALGTNPLQWDTDDDGLSDYQELYIGYQYQAPQGTVIETVYTSPLLKDSDFDGAPDLAEANNALEFIRIFGGAVTRSSITLSGNRSIEITDVDYDPSEAGDYGIPSVRSDATNPDTDGDGILDGQEIADITDPRIPNRRINVAMNTLYVDAVDDEGEDGNQAHHHGEVAWWVTVRKFDSSTNTFGVPHLLSSAADSSDSWYYGLWLNDWDNPTNYQMTRTTVLNAGWVRDDDFCKAVPIGSLTQEHAAFNVNKSLDFDLVDGDYLLVSGLAVELDTQYLDWYGCGRGPDNHTNESKPEPAYIPYYYVGECNARINQKIPFDTDPLTTLTLDTSASGVANCDISADVVISAD
jgi:hypothetical protein